MVVIAQSGHCGNSVKDAAQTGRRYGIYTFIYLFCDYPQFVSIRLDALEQPSELFNTEIISECFFQQCYDRSYRLFARLVSSCQRIIGQMTEPFEFLKRCNETLAAPNGPVGAATGAVCSKTDDRSCHAVFGKYGVARIW